MAEKKQWKDMNPEEKKKAKYGCLIGIVIIIACFAMCSGLFSSGKVEHDGNVYNDELDGSVEQVETYLKNSLKDPNSYDPIEWSPVKQNPQNKNYVVRHKYSAKNAFGGTITVNQIFTLDSVGNVIDVSDCSTN